MPLTVGGGVRSADDARALLLAGADKVAVNSAAVARPKSLPTSPHASAVNVWLPRLRKAKRDGWEIFTHGGRKPTASMRLNIGQAGELGAGELLVTSMDRDGHARWLRPEHPRDCRCGEHPRRGQRRRGQS